MAYANREAVKARAGRLGAPWKDGTEPGLADLDVYLQDVAGEIDAYIAARGFAVPATGSSATALRSLNIDGALILALEATYPAEGGRAAAQAAIDGARARFELGMASLAAGTHPAVLVLESGADAPGAKSYWDAPDDEELDVAPTFTRTQVF